MKVTNEMTKGSETVRMRCGCDSASFGVSLPHATEYTLRGADGLEEIVDFSSCACFLLGSGVEMGERVKRTRSDRDRCRERVAYDFG